jgi:murein DD-endopeptidase MepM/ murein hydrolase activator NlpD
MMYKNQVVDWPLASNLIRRGENSNTFGNVRHNADGSPRTHQGWDFYAPTGTQVFAIASGSVAAIRTTGDYGNVIVLFHSAGSYSAYCHLSRIDVAVGQRVALGDKIGLSGCTGNAAGMTGADQHLHFEIRTVPAPGLGLDGRISPLQVFGVCPLHTQTLRGQE